MSWEDINKIKKEEIFICDKKVRYPDLSATFGMGAIKDEKGLSVLVRGLRRDDPRRKHVRARARCNVPTPHLSGIVFFPSCMCRRHSARPPRERNSSSRGLINDHRVFPQRRNHLHSPVISRDCAPVPLCAVRRIFSGSYRTPAARNRLKLPIRVVSVACLPVWYFYRGG